MTSEPERRETQTRVSDQVRRPTIRRPDRRRVSATLEHVAQVLEDVANACEDALRQLREPTK